MADFVDEPVDKTDEAEAEPMVEHYVDAALEAYWWSWGEQYCELNSCLLLKKKQKQKQKQKQRSQGRPMSCSEQSQRSVRQMQKRKGISLFWTQHQNDSCSFLAFGEQAICFIGSLHCFIALIQRT